jgi:hypothetical protein
VFGEHTIRAYVYAAGSHEAIEFRPVDARLSLPAGCCSYFFEEFSQYFCVDQAFGQASRGLATVLHQNISVNTLEHLNRRMGGQAEGFLDELPTPGEKWESNGTLEAFLWAEEQIAARRRLGQKLLRLMDGQESLWSAADNCLSVPPEDIIDILDILHASSYVWKAAKAFYSHVEHREAFARDRLLRILYGDVNGVIAGLRQMATKRGLKGNRLKQITTVCGYFAKHAHRMRYDEYLAAGYPIATGVIEGACRHLVKDRMERSGMRWRLAGAQAMLHVRAVYQSAYWDDFHKVRTFENNPHCTRIAPC